MSKKILLSALLISSFSFANVFASAAEVDQVAITTPASTVSFKNCVFTSFPLASSSVTATPEISFLNCTLSGVDSKFFIDNPTLEKLAFSGSRVDFSAFKGGKFGQGCTNLKTLNLKEIKDFTFEQFLASASSDLLNRIVAETCKLRFSRADSGATLARFRADSNSEELTLEEIKRYISMYRTAQRAIASDSEAAQTKSIWERTWEMFGGGK